MCHVSPGEGRSSCQARRHHPPFHGGFTSAKEEFCVNDVVPVYRYTGKRYQKYAEVGKIKITGYVGEHYLEGVVVEGNIKDSDFAKKTNAACLIHLPESDEK